MDLSLAADKTEIISLKGTLVSHPTRIFVDGRLIRMSEKVKYLGVVIGARLGMTPHVDYVTQKVSKITSIISRVARAEWGMDFRCLRVLYEALYLSIAGYAIGTWYERMGVKIKKGYEMSEREALLKTVKAYRSTSTAALQVLAGALPIDLALKEKWMMTRARMGMGVPELEGKAKAERKRIVQRKMMEEWNERWTNGFKGAETKEYIPDVWGRMKSRWLEPDHYVSQLGMETSGPS